MKINSRDYSEVDTNIFHSTPEGYLTGKMCVTGAGVFRYMGDNGQIINRVRPVEEVKKSIPTLNIKPIVLTHPNEDVTPENIKSLSVGMSANDAEFDGLNGFVTVTVTDKTAIDAIKRGDVKAFSCGYDCNVTPESGVWQGMPHDEKQSDMIYNHIALVYAGRAGDSVRFRVGDSSDIEKIFNKQKDDTMKTLTLDSVQYQADEAVIAAFQKATHDVDALKTDLATANKEKDVALAARDALQAELKVEKEKSKSSDTVDAAVSEKVALIDKAKSFGCEVKAADSTEAIMSSVILKAYDGIDLKGKSPDYFAGMFDSACRNLELVAKNTQKSLDSRGFETHLEDSDPEKAYNDMCSGLGKKKQLQNGGK